MRAQPQKKLYDKRFEKVEKIGEGSYGCVYKVVTKGIKKYINLFLTYFFL